MGGSPRLEKYCEYSGTGCAWRSPDNIWWLCTTGEVAGFRRGGGVGATSLDGDGDIVDDCWRRKTVFRLKQSSWQQMLKWNSRWFPEENHRRRRRSQIPMDFVVGWKLRILESKFQRVASMSEIHREQTCLSSSPACLSLSDSGTMSSPAPLSAQATQRAVFVYPEPYTARRGTPKATPMQSFKWQNR